MQELCNSVWVEVAALQLPGGHHAVLKTTPALRASTSWAQMQAEEEAATILPRNPCSVTVLATGTDSKGNVSTVTPLAGVCLGHMAQHPDWEELDFEVKLAAMRWMMACLLPVLTKLQAAPDGARLYRDTKPHNIAYNPSTGLFAFIDFGLMCREDGQDYHYGLTGRYLTPEMAQLTNGQPLTVEDGALLQTVTNHTTDVYLLARTGLDMIIGVIPEINMDLYDTSDEAQFVAYLSAVNRFDWRTCEVSASLLSVGLTEEDSFFSGCMDKDPSQRLSPAQALQHPFIACVSQQVQAAVAQALPGYVQSCNTILGLLEGVWGQPGVFKPCPVDVSVQSCSSESGPCTPSIRSGCNSPRSNSSSGGSSSCSGSIQQASAGAPRKRSFLQRATKLLNKLKPSSHKASTAAGAQSSAAGSSMGPWPVASVGDGCAVSLPGWCGLLRFSCKARSSSSLVM
jgi:hypothetical protein